jgi:hypothetical protein
LKRKYVLLGVQISVDSSTNVLSLPLNIELRKLYQMTRAIQASIGRMALLVARRFYFVRKGHSKMLIRGSAFSEDKQ